MKSKVKLLIIIIIFLTIFVYIFVKHVEHPTNKKSISKETSSEQEKKKTLQSETASENKTKKGFIIEQINGVTYIDDTLIVNKTYSLPDTYGNGLEKEVLDAFDLMKADASAIGLNIYIASSFRSYEQQVNLYNKYVLRDGKDAADTYSARPGYSEHQSGLSFDLNSINSSFTNTAEGKWVNDNCYLYGFIIRFPEGKENETGYKYESWHLRFVGKELAKKLYNNGDWLSLEGYFGIDSKYQD